MRYGGTRGEPGALSAILADGTFASIGDRDLVDRFATRRDAHAFEVLMARHGPRVLNTCRKLLRHPQDVEDAFQATFLVLVRRAGSLRVEESLGPWISTVAYRVASRARARRSRREAREIDVEEILASGRTSDPASDEAARLLREEVDRLPDRLRMPLVLCYLHGMSHPEAARELGCPVGTVRSRLARGRARLRARLERMGIATADLTAALPQRFLDQAPRLESLCRSTMALMIRTANVAAPTSLVPASILELTEGVLKLMAFQRGLLTSLLVPTGMLLAAGVWLGIRYDDPSLRQANAQAVAPPPVLNPSPAESLLQFQRAYYVGDLLPAPRPGTQAQVDMTPVMDLIRHTIAPGSWRVQDAEGREILSEPVSQAKGAGDEGGRGPAEPKGAMTPFYLSISLIVRHTPEVHDQVAYLLRYLRETQDRARNSPEAHEERIPSSTAPHAAQPRPTAPAPSSRKERLRALVEQLRRELEETPDERLP